MRGGKLCNVRFQLPLLIDAAMVFILTRAPLYIILSLFADDAHAFKHVGNVIYTTLGHLQRCRDIVEINHATRCILELLHKLFGQVSELLGLGCCRCCCTTYMVAGCMP